MPSIPRTQKRVFIRCSYPGSLLAAAILCCAFAVSATAVDNVTINAGSVVSDVSHHPIGINMDYLMDDDSHLSKPPARSTRDALAAMGVKYLRFPGGEKSQNYLWSVSPWTSAVPRAALPGVWPTTDRTYYNGDKTTPLATTLDFDEFMAIATSIGAEPVIAVNSDSQYIAGGPTEETLLQTAENWVRYANVVKGYNIKYWMIGNETWKADNYAGATTAANHRADVSAFSQRMKAVDPTIKIIACGNGTNTSWNSTVLAGSNDFDSITINGYFNPGTGYSTYQSSNRTYENVTTIISQIATYSQPGDGSRIRPCYYEWNGIDWSDSWANNNDMGHALLNFQIQGDMLNKPGWDFSCLWNTRWIGDDPKSVFNALKADGSFTAVGQSLAIWGNYLLDKMVSCSSTNQLIRVYGSTTTSGSMNAFLINKDTVSHTVNVSLGYFNPRSTVECWQMTGVTDIDQAPVWAQKASLTASGTTVTVTVPALSITVLKFASANPAPSITSVSPSSGSGVGGTTVTISGSNLSFPTAVAFDGIPATSFSASGSNSVTCVTPAHGPGPVSVAVTTTAGSGTKANAYNYVVGITASAGTNGSISPSGYVPIYSATNQTFTITANSGYMIGDVKVDGVSVGALPTYTFTNVIANHTIAATFAVPAPDTTPPVITTPGAIWVDATSASGAVVDFVTSAFDAVSGAVPTHDSIASGSLFPVGKTTVTVTAQDGAGNSASASFDVNVFPVPLVKANNVTALNVGSSWVGGVAPGVTDTATWSGTYSAGGTVSVGTGLTAERLRIGNVDRNIAINASTGSVTLTGQSGTGIDMDAATKEFSIAAPVVLKNSQEWSVAVGRTLTVSGAITDIGAGRTVTKSGPGTLTLSGSGSALGALSVSAGTVNQNGSFNGTIALASASAVLNLGGGSVSGPVVANGTVNLLGSAPITTGAISGSGSSGSIICSNSSAYGARLTFAPGSQSFTRVSNASSSGTLILNGTGAAIFSGTFGFNTGTNWTTTLNGGSWTAGILGVNASSGQNCGTFNITGGASLSITAPRYGGHGTFNVGGAGGPGLLAFGSGLSSENGGASGLFINLLAGGTMTSPGMGLGLPNANQITASALTIQDDGTASIGGALTLGNTTTGKTETISVSLLGGKLLVSSSISAATATAGQTRVFHWTDGQLSALTITSGTNWSTESGSNGGITQGGLVQSGGVFAPGGAGVSGKMTVNGTFASGPLSTLALDLGGTTQATGFQTAGQYDYLSVTGTAASFSGTLAVSLISGFVPSAAQTFTVVSSTGTLRQSFVNLISGSRVLTTNGGGAFLVSATGNKITLSDYLVIAPPVITTQPSSLVVNVGAPMALTVSASTSSLSPLSYQWRLGGTPIAGATNATYSLTSATVSDAGPYTVAVTNSAGTVTSATATLTVVAGPSAPTGLSATGGNTLVALSWNASAGATSYKVKRGTVSGSFVTTYSNITGTSYSDTAVANGITYYYVVTALNASGEGEASTEVSARPYAPISVGEASSPAVALSGSVVSLTVTGAAGRTYQLQRSATLADGSWMDIGLPVVGIGVPIQFQDPSGAFASRLFYRVQITP